MNEPIGVTAHNLSRSPLGIIALFIVLIYGFASLLLGLSADSLSDQLKFPFVYFLVGFPVFVFGVFAWLVATRHENLYAPSDFVDQKMFLELQVQLQSTRRRVDVLAELSPGLVVRPLSLAPPPNRSADSAVVFSRADPEDPQRGKWGGSREAENRRVTVGSICSLRADPNNYSIPLEVRSTSDDDPLRGPVRFHLHDTFNPDVVEATVENEVAKLSIVAYGAFTVGIETDSGTRKLEINLADTDIDAPESFRNS